MTPHTHTRARVFVAAGTVAAALGLAGAGGRAVNAQPSLPEAYRRVDAWQSRPLPRPAGEITAAAGVDVAADGSVFVVDAAEGNVHVLAPDGAGRSVIGSAGHGPGQLHRPTDVDVRGGRAYVTDTGNRRVQVFDAATGRFVAAWSNLGRPHGIAVGAARAYVTDAETDRVWVMDLGGAVVGTWGADGGTPGLASPRGIDVDAAGTVAIADPGAGAIVVVRPDGQVATTLTRATTNPDFMAVDVAIDGSAVYAVAPRQAFAFLSLDQVGVWVPGAYLVGGVGIAVGPGAGYVATVQDNRADFSGVYHYPTRQPFSAQGTAWGGSPAPLGALHGPRRLDAGPTDVFVLDARPRVQRWGLAGTPSLQWRSEGAIDVAAGPGGTAFVVEPQHLRHVGSDGRPIWDWPAPDGAWLTAGAAADRLLVLDLAQGRVLSLPPGGPGPGGAEAIAVGGLVVDVAAAPGRLLVADRAARALRLLDAAGRELDRWPFPGQVARVAAARDGSAWFALTADGWVWKYAPDGSLRAAWDGAPEGTPLDLAVDAADRVLVADGSGDRIFAYAMDPTAERPTPPAARDRCDLRPDKTAAPAAVRAGEPVTVTLTVGGDCPAEGAPIDVVLVLDRSSSMQGPKFAAARSAVAAFAAETDFQRARVGLITFNQGPSLDQGLTADPAALVRALPALEASGNTNIGLAVREARAELAGPRGRAGVAKAVVLLTDGLPQQPSLALGEAQLAREAGIAVYAIGLGGDLDPGLLVQMAGGEDRYFGAPTQAELAQVFARVARRLATGTLLRTLTIVDRLPANMAYEAGSAEPPAAWDGSALRWVLADVPAAGTRLRYRVRPAQAGVWPTNVEALGDHVDGVGFAGRLRFPVPRVSVAGPRAAFLPLVFQNRCVQRRADVALVIDTSTSMLERAAPGGPTKLDAARGAARAFVRYLGLPADQAAVVAFSSDAALVQGLTGDAAAVDRALAGLPLGSGTRIDRGLAVAQAELTGPRHRAGGLPVVVLLTDGQPAGGSVPATLAQAQAMRQAGVAIFTIGLGADADGALLVDIAGDAERYSYAPDQGALERIYRTIAWSLPCR